MWHNYGFDRHVMFNSPDGRKEQRINCMGFAGDTMHMARLWDTSMEKISGDTGFSLEALTVKLLGEQDARRGPVQDKQSAPCVPVAVDTPVFNMLFVWCLAHSACILGGAALLDF